MPVFTGDVAVLDAKVKALSGDGTKIATAAGDVHSAFGGLRAFYKAPEAEQLFATTRPVVQTATAVSSEVSVIAGALGTYASNIRPLVARLNQLRQDAADFRAKVDGDDKWNEDGDLVDENLSRRNEIAEVWAAFQEAERACHAKIVALVGGDALKADDGSNKKGMYGYDAEALKQAESLPWGDAVQESTRWYQVLEHAWDFATGFVVDGLGGTLAGLGTLVGVDGWDAAKQAWTGLAKLVYGVVLLTTPLASIYLAMPDDKLHPWLRESRTAMKETGKALVAWDQWGEKPGRAAGAATFNVVTTICTGGAGGAVSGAGKAGAAAKAISLAGKAGRAVDPMTYVFKGAGVGLMKIGDVMAGLKGMGNIEIPKINEGAFSLPEGSLMLPDGTIQLPKGTATPDGATRLPDGNTELPEGTVTLPPGTVRLSVDGTPQYLDPAGNVYNAAGDITQRAEDAKTDVVDSPRTDTPAKVEIREPVGVGARGGDDVTRVGSDISDPARAADNLPGSRPDTTPGGTADNTPHNSADNTPRGSGHGEPPSPASHTDPIGGTADNGLHNSHTDPTPTGGGGHITDTTPAGGDHTPGGGGHGSSGRDGGQPPTGGHGADPLSSEQPRPFERGGETEQQIRENMRRSKVKPGDLDKALANLADHPAGQEVADLIASGQFKGMTNFDQVVSSFSQKNAMSGGVEQLRLADRLQKSGVTDISFEIKKDIDIKPGVTTGPKTDMDVMARDADGNVYGYQFKEVANPKKVTSKMWQNIGQLADSGADVKIFVVDTKGSVSDLLTSGIQKDLARIHTEQGVIVVLRVEDGTLMYPPGASFMPGGRS
ncbi:hypothetical protein J7E89_26665 [Streptomyces sp. ISL-100]|nr:hypothetical protein [Streptomyces sp. ISL-100]